VKPGKVKLAVVEQGTLGPSNRNDVLAQVEGGTTIKSLRLMGRDW